MITKQEDWIQSDAAPMRKIGIRSSANHGKFRRRSASLNGDCRQFQHGEAGCQTTSKPARFFACGEEWSFYFLGARLVSILFLLLATTLRAPAAVTEVGPIRITVGDLDQALHFYTQVLTFKEVSRYEEQGTDFEKLTGITGAHTRIAVLKLGNEKIELADWLNIEGRPVPMDSQSYDHWFQHIAIVVSDMDRAYEYLRAHKVKHVSTAPQTLPDWNPNAGGIKAFYFRDPEDHVLEIIWFPKGKGDPKWQTATAQAGTDVPLFLGIDHTAIVVSDTDRSLAFYRDQLGLSVAGTSENYGVEQEHLNQVFGARLHITGLRAPKGPGIEFLEYITPPGGRPIPTDRTPDDLSFWVVQLKEELSVGSTFSRSQPVRLVADPDGHELLISPGGSHSTAQSSNR